MISGSQADTSANVFALFPVRRKPRLAPSLSARVRLSSRVLSLGFLTLAVLFAVLVGSMVTAMFLVPGGMVGLGPQGGWLDTAGHMPRGYTALGDLPFREKLTYLLIAVVREGPKLAILLNQAALFRLYSEGAVFQPANARRLRETGAWLLADGIAPMLCHLVLAATGLEMDRRWAHLGSVQEAIVGLLLFIIAAVMTLGREIEDDARGFV
jgi:hypothetical protein